MTVAGEKDHVPGNGFDPDQHLGSFIRKCRREKHLTLAELSNRAGISKGLLSKIENGQTSSNLTTLTKLAEELDVPLSSLLRSYEAPPVREAQLVKAGEGMEVVRRGTKKGHTYHLLAHDKGPTQAFEPFLITITNESEVFPMFEHPGVEFIYMLEGKIEYRHGQFTYLLEPGDSLAFSGETPHGPERLVQVPARFLAVINYSTQSDNVHPEPPRYSSPPSSVPFSELIRALS
jgi:transcriptional regulator with XRE-family HTH domain